MGDVVSFRATDEELALIDRTQRQLGLGTRGEAIRHLLREGALRRAKFSDSPLARFRLPRDARTDRTWSSREIDASLYDDPARQA